MSIHYPAIQCTPSTQELTEIVRQINQHLLEIGNVLDNISTSATIPDRSIEGIKLVLETVTGAEILDGTITEDELAAGAVTATKIDVAQLDDITVDVGVLSKGMLQSDNWSATKGFQIDLTNGTMRSGGSGTAEFSVSELGILTATQVDITGKAIITTAGSEIGPFSVTSAKLYSAVEHNASQSIYNTMTLDANGTNPLLNANGNTVISKTGVLTAGSAIIEAATLVITDTNVAVATGCIFTFGGGATLGEVAGIIRTNTNFHSEGNVVSDGITYAHGGLITNNTNQWELGAGVGSGGGALTGATVTVVVDGTTYKLGVVA